MKTTLIYGLFIFFIVSIPVIIYSELSFSLGLTGQFALGLVYLIILAIYFIMLRQAVFIKSMV